MVYVKENTETIKSHYDSDPLLEWERANENTIEYIITARMLEKYIKPGEKVLDVGGGPGRFSLWLASRGCDVTLFDLSDKNVEFAKGKAKEKGLNIKTICGNALDESLYPDEKFDHILVMGPMYHLFRDEDRRKVIEKALVHLKDKGKIYIAFINLFAGVLYNLDVDKYGFMRELELIPEFGECLVKNKTWYGMAFTEARFDTVHEIKSFCNSF